MPHNDISFARTLGALRQSTTTVAVPAGGLLVLGLLSWLTVYDPVLLGPVAGLNVLLSAVLLLTLRRGHEHVCRHLHAHEKHKNQMVESAHRDALTGAFSRSFFLGLMKREIHEAPNAGVGYLQIDLDNLKALNDGNGHAAGDAALKRLIETVEGVVPAGIVGRLGGDEFGIVVAGENDPAVLRRLGQRILEDLAAPTTISDRLTRLSATVGITTAPRDGTDVGELISKADLALYEGKRAGRGRVVTFNEEMMVDARHKRFIERELRGAILLNELEMHYQPIYSAGGTVLRGYEALVRWRHPVRSIIPPSQFIPIAEQSTLIDKLGDWVIRRVCRDMEALGRASVSVNVSAAQLQKPDFAHRFIAILREGGATPDRITVEVTETVPLKGGAVEMANLKALRRHGVKVAIDDFGAGYANLQYLRDFEFDIIKIDRTYVANLETSRVDAMIVAAICKIARPLDVDVIAEGVETRAQFDMLRNAGCTAMQGYLLGRPAALGQLAAGRGGLASVA